jgi:hypothetical protein
MSSRQHHYSSAITECIANSVCLKFVVIVVIIFVVVAIVIVVVVVMGSTAVAACEYNGDNDCHGV